MFCYGIGGGVIKQYYHATTTTGVIGFRHARIDGVTMYFCHVMGCDVAKMFRFGNIVGEGSSIIFFKKYYLIKILYIRIEDMKLLYPSITKERCFFYFSKSTSYSFDH